jgi:predicted PurR-regulated permease PerM
MQSPPLSSNMRLLAALVALLAGIAVLIYAFPLFEALLIAALLAFLINPLVRFCMRKLHLRRALAAALVYFVLLIIVASIPAALGTLAVNQVMRLNENLQVVVKAIQDWLSQPWVLYGFDLSPRNLIQQFGQSAAGALTSVTGSSLSILSGVTTNFLWVLLVFVSLYYFLKDGPKIKPWLVSLASPDYQSDVDRLLDELNQVWGVFMRIQVLIFIILVILFLIGTSLVVWLYQIGWLPFSTLGLIIMLILVFVLVQQVDNLWLRPQMLGSQLRLHPGVVFVSLIGALALGGALAAIVAVPLLASVKVIGRYTRQKLLRLPPWPDDPTPEE